MDKKKKFKAKQLNSGKWFEGDLVRLGNRVCIGGDHIKDGITEVDPSTVCQFTGQTDCEGNELYEHDFIKNYPFMPAEIVWSEELSGYYLKYTNGKIEDKPLGHYLSLGKFIVVGNKFDKEK